MMDDVRLDGNDVKAIDDVMHGLRAVVDGSGPIAGNNHVRFTKVEFTIYDEHRVTLTRSGKWQPLLLRRIRKVLQ